MKRVGAEIAATERWKDVGKSYAEHIEGAYHQHRLQVVDKLTPPVSGKRVVDFGCGEGVLIRKLVAGGAADVIGIDIDPQLLNMAAGAGASKLILGGVDKLSEIDRADVIIAANVAAYFTAAEDAAFYREAKRILGDDGHLVITHSNSLFDLFTFNAYTVNFCRENFGFDPSPLLQRPDQPSRSTFNIRENPLAYPAKLLAAGFEVVSMEFINQHSSPPLLSQDDPDDMHRTRPDTLSTPQAEKWKLNFQCSMFGVCAAAA